MTIAATPSKDPRGNSHDEEYQRFLRQFAGGILLHLVNRPPLFTTDADGLYEAYLMAMPTQAEVKHHTCKACQQFIEHFGSLVTIDEQGRTHPLLWACEEVSPLYWASFTAMARRVHRARVTGVFLSPTSTLGKPFTGNWQHLHCHLPADMVFKDLVKTPHQAMAVKREDFNNVVRALELFRLPLLKQALTLLDTDSLYRSEKVRGPAQWLHDLATAVEIAHDAQKDNLVWRAIATAPAGFCHPRASMVGTLLDDLAAGMDFAEVSRRFAAKMHPLQYQRPQTAPDAGTVAQAEKLMAQLGAAGSLARRFARPDEVQAIWRPKPDEKPDQKEGGIFGHLATKQTQPEPRQLDIPTQTMTWDKFQRTVLSTAERIELFVRPIDNFAALTTAVNPDAPPILQWDSAAQRNPVSMYLYTQGSAAAQWNLPHNTYHPVLAVSYLPPMWGRDPAERSHHGRRGVLFLLDGARDSQKSGNALFPEILNAELHGIRSVIEAYSRTAEIEGYGQEAAAGLVLTESRSSSIAVRLRVISNGNALEYLLDRWD